jgi:hypothetical protein
MGMKKFLWPLMFSLAACAPRAPVAATPDPVLEARLVEAGALLEKGCYLPLRRAWRTYSDLYAQPALRKRVVVPFLKASILLAARERDLGFITPVYLNQATQLVDAEPDSPASGLMFEVVGFVAAGPRASSAISIRRSPGWSPER